MSDLFHNEVPTVLVEEKMVKLKRFFVAPRGQCPLASYQFPLQAAQRR
jgi:hypothetical protein